MSSNFEKVKEFNKAFGLDIPSTPRPEIFQKNPDIVALKRDLIIEEVEELRDAIKDENIVEVADALGDILYVVYGAGIAFGLDMDHVFGLIHLSNMSKLCKTKEEALETVEWYKKEFENHGYD